MELKQLRHFIAIVETGSLSKAAPMVRVAQPALSTQLAQLEAELGIRLVTRTRRGVVPTEAGERLYRHARAIVRQVDEARSDVLRGAEEISGNVSIGLLTSTAMLLALPLLQETRRTYPGVKLRIFESFSGYLSELVLNNRLDVAILLNESRSKGIDAAPLLTEGLCLLSRLKPDDDPAEDTIDMHAIAGRPLVLPSRTNSAVRALIDRSFGQLGIELNVVADMDSLSTMRNAAVQGIAETILPSCALIPMRQSPSPPLVRRLVNPGISRSLCLCRPEGAPMTSAISAVIDLLVRVILELLPGGGLGDARLVDETPRSGRCCQMRGGVCKAGLEGCPLDRAGTAWPTLDSLVRRRMCYMESL